MRCAERPDDFAQRREHLASLSDEALRARFWRLVEHIVEPLVAEARTHTTPSIERSVLLRMGLSSIEAKNLVQQMHGRGLLGHGAGRQIFELGKALGLSPRQVATELLEGRHWEELPR